MQKKKILRLLQTNELATFYSFDEIHKPQVDSDWLAL